MIHKLFVLIYFLFFVQGGTKAVLASEDQQAIYDLKIQHLNCLIEQFQLDSAYILYFEILDQNEACTSNDKYVRSSLQLSKAYAGRNCYDSALILSTISYQMVNSENVLDVNLSSEIVYQHALILYRQRKFDDALVVFEKSYDVSKTIHYDSIAVLSLKYIGNIHFTMRDYPISLEYYRKSLKDLMKSHKPSNIVASSLYQNIGISLSMLNENDSALQYLTKSVRMKELYLENNDPSLASGYLNISRLLQLNGELNTALEFIDRAETIFLKKYGENDPVMAPFYFNKGSILLSLNDFDEALHYHDLALELYRAEISSKSEIFPELFLNYGVINSNLGRSDDAISYFKQSLIGVSSIELKVRANLLLGIEFLNYGNSQNARKHLQKAIDISEKNLGHHNLQTANAYLNYGLFCEQTGKYKLALKYYLQAADIYRNIYGEKSRDLSNTQTLIGNFYLNIGNTDIALHYFQDALIAFIPDFNNDNLSVNPLFDQLEIDLNLFYTLAGKANSFYSSYVTDPVDNTHLTQCLETSKLAIRLFEKIKSTLYGENTKLIVTGRVNTVYNIATVASAKLYQLSGEKEYLNTCFQYSEKSKAAVLLSTAKEVAAIQVGNIPEGVKKIEKLLKRNIAQYQNIIFEENQKTDIDSSKLTRIRNKLFESKLKYDSLIVSLESDYPEYYNLKYNVDVISINEIQNELLDDNQTFIEYKLVDTLLYTFIIRKDTAMLLEKEVGSDFSEKINKYVQLISNFPKTDSVSKRSFLFANLGFEIANALHLKHPILSSTKNLIVIPDDVLGYLSFEALIAEVPKLENAKYNRLKYLVYDFSFSYGYSGTLLFNKIHTKRNSRQVLAMAPVYDSYNNSEIAKNTGVRDIEKSLTPLPFAASEVENVLEVYSGKKLIGEKATESEFKSLASEYNILHFAMHTLINDSDPLASKLVFTLNGDSVNDGFLNTYEIYNLDLNAELAVLSACKTGTGTISKGEGIMSLARGFLYAGVPGIIMTLWAVEDLASSNIISGFYKNLFDGQKKAEALRNAKLTYLDNADPVGAHPYFWAGYVQIGDNSPLNSQPNLTLYYSSAGILIILLLVGLQIRRLKRKKKSSSYC